MAGRLKGRRALITGGDSGIGQAVAQAFAREGADVAIVYLNDDRGAQHTRELVAAEERHCTLVKADVGVESEVSRIYQEAIGALGGLDVLVSNAAVEQRGAWEEFPLADWNRIVQTNLTGAFLVIREALRGGHLKSGGRIVITGSIQGLEGSASDPAYSATKGALHAMTRSLAKYLVDRRILVNAVAPGPVDTPMLRSQTPKLLEGSAKYPLGVASPEQIAPAYVFLASDDSSYMTGEVLALTGGKITA
ncbi:MAG TPA: SDR family oxidoreductase [Myxococcales bacterium]|jgi:NAD(P)-dependent dehydrogenase (short-subunit alcohol dehydrogenase family)